jgi:outer membrane receptor protein involved in Fe transport
LKTWTLKAGARYEYTFIQADYQNQQSAKLDIPAYSILVPSITLAKKLPNGNTIKASYNRRIQRPGLQALNPNVQSTNPLNVTQGNPYLHPEFGNNYELAYTANVQNNSFTVAYFMRMMTGDIQTIRDVIGKDTIRSIYQNLGLENNYGFNFLANISVSKKLIVNGGMDVFYRFIKNNDPNPLYTASNDGWSARYTLTASYLLPKDWGIQVFGTYRGKRVQLQGYQSGYYMYSLSLKKNLPHKKGSIGFGVENVFTPTIQIVTEVNSPTVQQYSTTVYHYLNLKLNLTYVLGKTIKSDKTEKPDMHELGGQ